MRWLANLRRVFAHEKVADPEVILARAKKAQELLNDPMLIEAWLDVEVVILRKWATSQIRDHEGQLKLRLMLQALHDVRRILEQRVEGGKIEIYKAKVRTKMDRYTNQIGK